MRDVGLVPRDEPVRAVCCGLVRGCAALPYAAGVTDRDYEQLGVAPVSPETPVQAPVALGA